MNNTNNTLQNTNTFIALVKDIMNKYGCANNEEKDLLIETGKKYYKIIVARRFTNTNYIAQSVYAFVDKETGDIYKPASYSAPRKNFTRGNVNNEETRLNHVSPWGIK